MKKFHFIFGGVRSGKSRYALELAKKISREAVFIATAIPFDKEMKERIRKHKLSRPKNWIVLEEPKDIPRALYKVRKKYKVVLIDCLGLLISNLLLENLSDGEIEKRVKKLVSLITKHSATFIVVSNDVGSGVVPDNALGRRFRDLVGLANQMMANAADEAILMQAGIPVKIK